MSLQDSCGLHSQTKCSLCKAVPLNNYDADPAQAMSTFGLWNLSRKTKTSGHYGRGF